MIWVYLFVIIAACFVSAISGKWMVHALARIAHFLGWREFVVAFIFVSLGTSIPNLFVGLSSALHNIPILSLGDVVGGNLVDLTLLVALATFIAGGLPINSKLVRTSLLFTIIVAVLPFILLLDGGLSRADGVVLLLFFFFYIRWLFAKEERFSRVYSHGGELLKTGFKEKIRFIFKNVGIIIGGLSLLLISAEAIVRSAAMFSEKLDASLLCIGLLMVGLGNALPEIFFSVASARAKQTGMILGSLSGSVIIIGTFVLGVVVLIRPIENVDLSAFAMARFFLLAAAVFFLIFSRTDRKITKKEASFLLLLYGAFVVLELLYK